MGIDQAAGKAAAQPERDPATARRQLTEWVGRRVALRHRVGERDGRPLLSDAVGELADGGADAVVVRARRGPVRVARDAVVAVRLVPPPVPRRASWAAVARLEQLCAEAWPAVVDVPLGAWRLRAAVGFTARANSVLAVGDPGVPVPEALDVVRAFADEHGVPARVQVPVGSPWDRAVADAGWVLDASHAAGAEVAVLVGELATLAVASAHDPRSEQGRGRVPDGLVDDPVGPTDPRPDPAHARDLDGRGDLRAARGVEVLDRPDERWWALAVGSATPAQRHVLDPDKPSATAFALRPGIGAARGAVVEDHLHLSRLRVVPDARRRGHGTELTAALAAWGLGRGARWAVLQVALRASGARAFYAGLGCVEHHRYRYLVPPPANQR